MSRFYKIVIGGQNGATFSNQLNGRLDPNAWDVELDIPAYGFGAPAGNAAARIWGVSLQQISQAADFNGAPITISGGMQAGLPLATAAAGQAGVLISGTIFQSFGNWIGTQQTLELVITADGGATLNQPANLTFKGAKGSQMGQAIQQALSQAYPGFKVQVSISPNLVFQQDEAGAYKTIQQFSAWAQRTSQQLNTDPTYPGVSIYLQNGTLYASDGTQASGQATQLNFGDLIGQPTWLDAFTVQFNTVMRSDLGVGSQVQFPALAGLQSISTQQSQSQARNKMAFSGTWTVSYVRHVGRARAPDAQSWITTFQAFSNQAPQSATDQAGNTSS